MPSHWLIAASIIDLLRPIAIGLDLTRVLVTGRIISASVAREAVARALAAEDHRRYMRAARRPDRRASAGV